MRPCRTVTGMYKLIKGLEEKRPEGTESASLFKAARTVLWSFAGIRKGRDHAADAASITPLQVITLGFAGAAIFVSMLILLVRHIAG